MDRKIFLDVETTGIDTSFDRVIEIGVIEVVDRRLGETLQAYVRPPVRVSEGARGIHGMSTEALEAYPEFREVWPAFELFISDDEILIHNAKFDVAILSNDLPDFGSRYKITDTLALSRSLRPRRKKHNLDQLCADYKIDSGRGEYHGALQDATALARVWLEMTVAQAPLSLDVVKTATVAVQLDSRPVVVRATAAELEAHRNFMLKHNMPVF